MSSELAEVILKYRCKGTLKGTDYLLKPQDALSFIQDLADHDVLISGCDLWKSWGLDSTKFLEIVGGGDLVNRRLSETDAQSNARTLKDFIANEWPEDADRISCVFADPRVWDLILQYVK